MTLSIVKMAYLTQEIEKKISRTWFTNPWADCCYLSLQKLARPDRQLVTLVLTAVECLILYPF